VREYRAELSGRLLPYIAVYLRSSSKLIGDCDGSVFPSLRLIPNFQYRQTPRTAPVFPSRAPDHRTASPSSAAGPNFADEGPRAFFVEVIDLEKGKKREDIPTSVGDLYISSSGRFAVIKRHERERSLKVHCLDDEATNSSA